MSSLCMTQVPEGYELQIQCPPSALLLPAGERLHCQSLGALHVKLLLCMNIVPHVTTQHLVTCHDTENCIIVTIHHAVLQYG